MSEHATPSRLSATVAARNVVIFLAAIIVIAVVINIFAHGDVLRTRIDATRTRAYSLSQTTQNLLREINEPWTVALLFVRENLSQAELRQLDEVLDRYTAASDYIDILRIDPTDPASLTEYERLLARLRSVYAREILAYDQALDAGAAMFSEMMLYAQQEAGRLQPVVEAMGQNSRNATQLTQQTGVLTIFAEQGGSILDQVEQYREISDEQPIPDYESARSVMAEAVGQFADAFVDLSILYDAMTSDSALDSAVRQFARESRVGADELAQRAAAIADPLRQLPEIELATIGEKIREGDAAVVLGPDRAGVIDARQLFPQINQRGGIAFDRRFRGEQLITATIRSLRIDQMPMVTFVHNEAESLFRPRERNADLMGVASTIGASRFDLREWIVSDRPQPESNLNQPRVWIIVPPIVATGTADRELALVQAAHDLIADGESVLLSINPSRLPQFGQRDPWASVAAAVGVTADTSSVIFERVDLGSGSGPQIERGQLMDDFRAEHPMCAAIHGQRVYFGLPVPLRWAEQTDAQSAVKRWTIAEIEPSINRWIEKDWALDPSLLKPPDDGQHITEASPVVLAIERPNPVQRQPQRAIVVASGGWMLSYIADSVMEMGNGRVALTNPGNQELMLAAIAWLARMDELIAPSPVSRQVARLDGISTGVWLTWFSIGVLGLPLVSLGAGAAIWLIRRN